MERGQIDLLVARLVQEREDPLEVGLENLTRFTGLRSCRSDDRGRLRPQPIQQGRT